MCAIDKSKRIVAFGKQKCVLPVLLGYRRVVALQSALWCGIYIFFYHAQIDLRKARERELGTLDDKSRSSGIDC